mmetsp:Transcript_11379/g.14822  ORF Transcript_11379/g.14822 Transcript_11379/m.14822 type:complete len:179 (+) Transcript_11379:121-657(+)|eukprot:CAMPEP_0204830110 /NCGR_PEP_ID=MMETSP1346-20131115/8342_1 /ASSEMBLY_ACC=CAM_ASM_000771 /TAXON_ID=215587 /ORGANISM="Aplanochytrium stocchinoi, Strain GSBS06" /LENGTH=178 /DNA_ID=CAMNT_0051960247 /DNA_START=95 /DNA_END=631 /DNA_ORIENTATION=-
MSALKREEPWKGHSDLQEIYPRVFLTNAFGARNLRKLEEKNITHILVAGLFLDKPFLNSKKIEIIYEQLDLCDNATERDRIKMREALPFAMKFIDNALESSSRSNVLIHCGAGRSRSGAVAVAYVLHSDSKKQTINENTRKNGDTKNAVQQAIDVVRKIRPIVEPNDAFIQALEDVFA